NRIENTADLTGLDEARVEVVEDLRVLLARVGERVARLDVVLELVDHLAEDRRLALRAEDLQALEDRKTCVDHRRELAREHHDLVALHRRAERRERQVLVETLALLLDLGRDGLDALRAQTDDDG